MGSRSRSTKPGLVREAGEVDVEVADMEEVVGVMEVAVEAVGMVVDAMVVEVVVMVAVGEVDTVCRSFKGFIIGIHLFFFPPRWWWLWW